MLPHRVQEPIPLKMAGKPLFAAYPVARGDRRAAYINKVKDISKQDGGEHVTE
jgi:hypothetical protein